MLVNCNPVVFKSLKVCLPKNKTVTDLTIGDQALYQVDSGTRDGISEISYLLGNDTGE